jgi:hypothetical protein
MRTRVARLGLLLLVANIALAQDAPLLSLPYTNCRN